MYKSEKEACQMEDFVQKIADFIYLIIDTIKAIVAAAKGETEEKAETEASNG